MKDHWRESLIVGGLAFVFYLVLGGYLSLYRDYLPYDSLARLVSAWLVFDGTETKLSTIGFVWPPLPTLLILPLAWINSLVHTWLAVVIVSAFFMALSSVIFLQIARFCEISKWWRRGLVFLYALNPLIVVFGSNGMSEAVLVAVTLGACYWLIRFWKTGRNTALIFTAGLFGLLPLIRYEFTIITVWSGLLLILLSWHRRQELSRNQFQQYLEGRLLAYTSLAIYPLFLWIVASWFIMGNPLYFIFNDRSAVSLAEYQLQGFGLTTNPFQALILVSQVWSFVFILGMVATIAAVVFGIWQKNRFFVWLTLTPLLIPFLQFILLVRGANVPLLRYFLMAIPFGLFISMILFLELKPYLDRYRWGPQIIMGGCLLLFIFSNLVTYQQLINYPYQNIEKETWRALLTNEELENRNFNEAYVIGNRLLSIVPQGSRVLIDTYQFGFGIILGSGYTGMFMDFTDPNYEKALINPHDYVDYVIVPTTEQRGAFYEINRFHKKLHEEGASWAIYLDVLPPTALDWKLYEVIK